MPSTLDKTRKRIAKKRNGNINSLHHNSRNSKKLHRALIRDGKLAQMASARKKNEQPKMDRTAFFFQAAKENESKPFTLDAIHSTIKEFVHQHDEEYDELKKARRSGRPPSVREELLKAKIAELKLEYHKGFYMPDLSTEENVKHLDRWEGSWAFLSSLSWVKVAEDGTIKPSVWNEDR